MPPQFMFAESEAKMHTAISAWPEAAVGSMVMDIMDHTDYEKHHVIRVAQKKDPGINSVSEALNIIPNVFKDHLVEQKAQAFIDNENIYSPFFVKSTDKILLSPFLMENYLPIKPTISNMEETFL